MKFVWTTTIVAFVALAACSTAPIYSYACTPSVPLTVQYLNSSGADAKARVTLDGRTYTLEEAPSGSGARYRTAEGRSPGTTLVWWNKGDEGTLLEGKASDPAAPETAFATCKQAP